MIYNSLRRNDRNNKILYKYFLQPHNLQVLNKMFEDRFQGNNSILEFELDLLENELQLFLSKQTFEGNDNILLNNIKRYFNNLLKYEVDYLYLSSPVFNDLNCLNKIYSPENIHIIKLKQEEIRKKIYSNIDKYINSEKLSFEENKNMFVYLSSDYINYNDTEISEKINKIIKKLLEDNYKCDYHAIRFLMCYVNKIQSKKYGYELSKVYIDNKIPFLLDNGTIQTKKFTSSTNCGGHINNGIIVMNTDTGNFIESYGRNLPFLIEQISHESWHHKQYDDFYNQRYTSENFTYIVNELLFSNWKFYRKNYDFLEVEYQANHQSYITTTDLLKMYSPSDYGKKCKISSNNLEIINSYRMVVPDIDSDISQPIPYDEYVVLQLEKIMKEQPELVKNIRLLQLFFNLDGNLKNINELIDSFNKLENKAMEELDYDCQYGKLFAPFFNYIIKNNNVSNEILTSDKMENIIYLLTLYEAKEIVKMIEGYEEFHKFEQQHLRLLNKNFVGMQDKLIKERLIKYRKYLSCLKNQKNIERVTTIISPYFNQVQLIENKGKSV